jgi:hypothetical protein
MSARKGKREKGEGKREKEEGKRRTKKREDCRLPSW